MISLRTLKANRGALLPTPKYVGKPYVVLNGAGVVLFAGTLDELRALPAYFDDQEAAVREHPLHSDDNKLVAPKQSALVTILNKDVLDDATFSAARAEHRTLVAALKAIDNATCNYPLMSLTVQHVSSTNSQVAEHLAEVRSLVLSIRAAARAVLNQ